MTKRLHRLILCAALITGCATHGPSAESTNTANSAMEAYYTCLKQQANRLSMSGQAPDFIADAAHSQCKYEFHLYKKSLNQYFLSASRGRQQDLAYKYANRRAKLTFESARKMVIGIVVENRMPTNKSDIIEPYSPRTVVPF